MPIYQNSIIYKLCHQNDLENKNIYVGSTTNFRNRKCQHKTNCNNENNKLYNYFVYQFIRKNGGWDEWQMIPIEVFPCNDKKELQVKERHHIEILKPKLNKQIPTRNKAEYYEDNIEKIKEYQKEYYNDNINKIKEQQKINSEIKIICSHCEVKIRKTNLKRHQQSKKCLGKQNIS